MVVVVTYTDILVGLPVVSLRLLPLTVLRETGHVDLVGFDPSKKRTCSQILLSGAVRVQGQASVPNLPL
jgi:hypothetical protein